MLEWVLLVCALLVPLWWYFPRASVIDVLSDEEVECMTDPEAYVRMLMRKGRSLENVVIHGMSALNYFLALYDEDLASAILKYGRGVCLSDTITGGFTPLHYAADNDMQGIVELLLERKAELEATTEDLRVVGHYESGGRTPLHLACLKGHDKVVSLLLAAGANRDALDFDENTPFILACISNHLCTAQLVSADKEPPSSEWLAEKAQENRAAAMARSTKEMTPTGTLLQVHTLQGLLSFSECRCVLREVLAATKESGWTANRHRAYATTDVQSSNVPRIDAWIRRTLRNRLFPQLKHLYFPHGDVEFSFRDLFYVKYCTQGQKGLAIHLDGSILSFNILLNPAREFVGGGTYVEHLDKTISISQGDCFVHSGRVRHAGTNVTKGVRFLLVGFVDVRLSKNRSLSPHTLQTISEPK